MNDLNKVILTGRLTADPELKYTQSGIAVCTARIAVVRNHQSKEAQESGQQEADFIPIVAWRHTAEYIGNYLTRGAPVMAEGSIQVREWYTPDGEKRFVTEVVAPSVTGLETKAQAEARNSRPRG